MTLHGSLPVRCRRNSLSLRNFAIRCSTSFGASGNIGRSEWLLFTGDSRGKNASPRKSVLPVVRRCKFLGGTDAAGEGINLQCAHLVVNHDLPSNPNRIEQRFDRVHRIGQTKPCSLRNLVAEQAREGRVYLVC